MVEVGEARRAVHEDRPAERYDGLTRTQLATFLDVCAVEVFDKIGSTMDRAHAAAAAGAPAGMLILADEQTAGRGTNGRSWSSPQRGGIWMTLLERPVDASGLDVLSLRVGLAAARALDQFAAEPLRLKWPNDLYVDGRKLGGALVEVRWRGERPEWVAIGLGVNVAAAADQPNSAGLDAGTSRLDALRALVPELRSVRDGTGLLNPGELEEYTARDLARGRECVAPVPGRVAGINSAGELLVEIADSVMRVRTGSLILE